MNPEAGPPNGFAQKSQNQFFNQNPRISLVAKRFGIQNILKIAAGRNKFSQWWRRHSESSLLKPTFLRLAYFLQGFFLLRGPINVLSWHFFYRVWRIQQSKTQAFLFFGFEKAVCVGIFLTIASFSFFRKFSGWIGFSFDLDFWISWANPISFGFDHELRAIWVQTPLNFKNFNAKIN